MLGLGSFEMALAYILCIVASVICVIYGIINWNNTGKTKEELQDIIDWQKEERELEEGMP